MRFWKFLSSALLLVCSGHLAAQVPAPADAVQQVQHPGAVADSIRLEAARWIGEFLDGGGWYAEAYKGKSRVLVPWTLPVVPKGDSILVLTAYPTPAEVSWYRFGGH